MGAGQELRRIISQRLVQKNLVLVREMENHNDLYGRSKSVWGRAKLVARLYWKYGILKQDPLKVKEMRFYGMEFPESGYTITCEDILDRVKADELLVFDYFGVMVNLSLNNNLATAMLEVISEHLGLAHTIKGTDQCSSEEKELLTQLVSDFSVKNDFILEVWKQAEKRGLNIAIRNNSTEWDNSSFKKLLEYTDVKGEIYDGKKKAVFVTLNSDIEKAIVYHNVNMKGNDYRSFWRKNTITAFYSQILNSKLHSGKKVYDLFYEYGFTCGGILTCGFCQFLNRLAKQEDVDKLIFVARDGDIIRKVYQRYFEEFNNEYLIFSRFASYELIFEDYPEEYIDKNIKVRMYREHADNSIRTILRECHLESLEESIKEKDVNIDKPMNDNSYEVLKQVLTENRLRIQEQLQESCNAANQYILEKARDSKKVCIVDVGWHGKSIVYLKHLLKKYGWDGEVIGAMIGATDDYITQSYIRRGTISTYAFEEDYWRRKGGKNGEFMPEEEIIAIEALFSSEAPTLLRYKYDESGKVDFIYAKENPNKQKIRQVHAGILDFTEVFAPTINKYNLRITARDAYTPLDYMMQNKSFRTKIEKEYEEVTNAINGF